LRKKHTLFKKLIQSRSNADSRRILLVEKTDRLYRHPKDWVTLDEFDIEIHLVKENVILSRDARSSEKFMHGIRVLMAKNYIDNLSEETKRLSGNMTWQKRRFVRELAYILSA
jgi:site-specific DNA recombinase